MDLPLSAGRIFTVSSLLKFCSAFSCSFVMLTVAGTLQVLRMLATETRIVSLAVWLRLKMPFSTEDKIFATGIFFGAIEKLKPFSRAEISTGFKVRCDTLTTQISCFSPVASEEKHLHTANKTTLHLQRRSHGLLRCEVSVHFHTCGLSPKNNQGEATTRPESSRTYQSFCWQHLETSDFVLNHNYFKHDGDHYKQIFGCAMGSPISPVLADLVMEEIEATAISTFSHPPKWWFRYVDDSHSCLRKDQVNEFHKHLNSINPNIQFTLELENTNGQGLPFLDTITTRRGTAIQVDVYRKPTHTDRYLDFLSCHPLWGSQWVVAFTVNG